MRKKEYNCHLRLGVGNIINVIKVSNMCASVLIIYY